MSVAGGSPCKVAVVVKSIPGKGEGLVAVNDIPPGTLLIDEEPLLLLDPPCKRNDIMKLLGCRLFSTIDMKGSPEKIRTQISQMVLDKLVARLSEDQRRLLFSFEDNWSHRSATSGPTAASKTVWGIWRTNCIPLESYKASGIFPTIVKLNHSCRPNANHLWCRDTGREQVWVVEPIKAGQEITISYIRTFCSRAFRQDLLLERFGFVCTCQACQLHGEASRRDDECRLEIDRLSQLFTLARNHDDPSEAISIGETILALMQEAKINSSLQWPGYFNCYELYTQAGDAEKARNYLKKAYQLVCQAKGVESNDAKFIGAVLSCPSTS